MKMFDTYSGDYENLRMTRSNGVLEVALHTKGKSLVFDGHTHEALVDAFHDIVLASRTAVFQDMPHFGFGIVPGDGVHLLWPEVIGSLRGRYFLWTQQRIEAEEALRLGEQPVSTRQPGRRR